jgi:hypothetical protein
MSKEELLDVFESFINEKGLVPDFNAFLESKGYSVEEAEKILENLL